jgi:hypothetical protein
MCGIKDRTVRIPARTTQDVRDWVKFAVGGAIGADHAEKSPLCRAKSMTMVKIPIPPGSEFVGQQVD